MNVTGVSSIAGNLPEQARAAKAGAQFEGILLNMVFGDLERVVSHLPGANVDDVSKSYSGFAMQALASGLSDNGGIGLGRLIATALMAHSRESSHPI
jgi:Rod binding domain-containing protein